jgi:hypothetical protein
VNVNSGFLVVIFLRDISICVCDDINFSAPLLIPNLSTLGEWEEGKTPVDLITIANEF